MSDHGETIVAAPRLLMPGGCWSGPGAVGMSAGRISRVVEAIPSGAEFFDTGALTPGLLDLHINGAFGIDFADADISGWRRALAGLAAHGVTAIQPTVITAPLAAILASMNRIALAADALADESVARVLGVHLEGPFLAHSRRGAHRADWLRDATPDALDFLLGDPAASHLLRTVTLAPERPHGLEAVRRLAAAGVIVAIGHSDATVAQAREAADAGAKMVTHLFNAMRPFAHRDPGLAGAALTDPRLWCCLIVDGIHVDPVACRLAFQAAGDRLVMVTDAILIAGLPRGTTREFGGAAVVMDEDGAGHRVDGTLAGAGIVLDEGVRRMIAAGVDPATVLRAATEAPARAIGRDDLGRLASGAAADLVWWDDDWVPQRVWIGGIEVFRG